MLWFFLFKKGEDSIDFVLEFASSQSCKITPHLPDYFKHDPPQPGTLWLDEKDCQVAKSMLQDYFNICVKQDRYGLDVHVVELPEGTELEVAWYDACDIDELVERLRVSLEL